MEMLCRLIEVLRRNGIGAAARTMAGGSVELWIADHAGVRASALFGAGEAEAAAAWLSQIAMRLYPESGYGQTQPCEEERRGKRHDDHGERRMRREIAERGADRRYDHARERRLARIPQQLAPQHFRQRDRRDRHRLEYLLVVHADEPAVG